MHKISYSPKRKVNPFLSSKTPAPIPGHDNMDLSQHMYDLAFLVITLALHSYILILPSQVNWYKSTANMPSLDLGT